MITKNYTLSLKCPPTPKWVCIENAKNMTRDEWKHYLLKKNPLLQKNS